MSNLTFLEAALLVINSVELAIIISMWSIIKYYIKTHVNQTKPLNSSNFVS